MSLFVFISPSFSSGIPSDANSATCNNSTLEKYNGSSNLTAQWTGNTINLHWYNDDDELTVAQASQSCTYGGGLTPPANIPTKTGYTFKGWRVRGGGNQQQCDLNSLDTSIDFDDDYDLDLIVWKPINGSSGYTVAEFVAEAVEDGDVVPGTDRSAGLSNGEWGLTFSYGTVHGMAACSNINPYNDGWRVHESDFVATGNGYWCWCKVTGYTPSGGSMCNAVGTDWVTRESVDSYDCASRCAYNCLETFMQDDRLRSEGFYVYVPGSEE